MSDKIDLLIRGIEQCDRRALARSISVVENEEEGVDRLLSYAYRNAKSHPLVIGLTGPGGAGKSTIVNQTVKELRRRGKKVAVMAVDPSSPYTGGAFLGDRIRMGRHNMDEGVFIRSFASRGCMGGISEGTKNALYLFKNYDFDVIIIESLGIGQDETDITEFVDATVVAVVPGYGDEVQIAKAGMQEIADIFVVNKADKPDAKEFYHQLMTQFLNVPQEIRPVILMTVATEGTGIPELADTMLQIADKHRENRPVREKARIRTEIETQTLAKMKRYLKQQIDEYTEQVIEKKLTPYDAANLLFDSIRPEGPQDL